MAVDPPKLFRIGKRPAASAEKARPAIIESHVQGADPPFCSASSTTTKKEGGGGARCSAHRAEYPRILEFACSRAPPRAPTWPGVSS